MANLLLCRKCICVVYSSEQIIHSRGIIITNKIKSVVWYRALYAVGGNDASLCMNSCEKFDIVANAWTNVANMHCRRFVHLVEYDFQKNGRIPPKKRSPGTDRIPTWTYYYTLLLDSLLIKKNTYNLAQRTDLAMKKLIYNLVIRKVNLIGQFMDCELNPISEQLTK